MRRGPELLKYDRGLWNKSSLDGGAQLLGLGYALGGHAEGLGHHHKVGIDVGRQPRLLVVTLLHTQPPGSQRRPA